MLWRFALVYRSAFVSLSIETVNIPISYDSDLQNCSSSVSRYRNRRNDIITSQGPSRSLICVTLEQRRFGEIIVTRDRDHGDELFACHLHDSIFITVVSLSPHYPAFFFFFWL